MPYYFRLGLIGFLGTLAWLILPAILIGATQRFPVLGALGALLLAFIVPFLPFLQVRYAVEGRASALFSRRAIRDRFRRAPWAFAFSLLILLVAAIPLYLLKLEMIPREAAWLPSFASSSSSLRHGFLRVGPTPVLNVATVRDTGSSASSAGLQSSPPPHSTS